MYFALRSFSLRCNIPPLQVICLPVLVQDINFFWDLLHKCPLWLATGLVRPGALSFLCLQLHLGFFFELSFEVIFPSLRAHLLQESIVVNFPNILRFDAAWWRTKVLKQLHAPFLQKYNVFFGDVAKFR